MNKYLLYFVFLFAYPLFSQTSIDSLNIVFSSDFEKSMISQTVTEEAGDVQFIKTLIALDSTYTPARAEKDISAIDNFLNGLSQKASRYNEKKRVKYIFDQVHDRFFRKYELDSYFSDIFKSSTYNCVTGTALYAYAFDKFKIPFQIKETPTHVFLVAYPHRHNIYIETTLPGKSGSYAPSENLIRKAVDELVDMKMITQKQVLSVGYNKAFNDYYYGDENIEKYDLIGIQYYNKAVVAIADKRYEDAYQNISKSRLFYKNEKTKLFNESLLHILVENTNFKKLENFKWILALGTVSEDYDYLKYKVLKILSEDSWTNKEYDAVEFELESMEKGELKNELLQSAYAFRADRYNKLQRHKKTLEYAEKIYALNSNDLTSKNYICESHIMALAQKNMTVERLTDLTSLTEKYPFIAEFGVYTRYKIYLYAFLTATSFDGDKSKDGLKYLEELETLMNEQADGIDFSQEAVGNAYGSVGAYYYRKKNKTKAVEYLKRGLKYSPDNPNINRKLKLIETSY